MPNIEVSEETLQKIKEQFKEEFEEININDFSDLIGKTFFFRTVSYHSVGKVDKIIGDFLQLSSASWVADSGRLSNAIKEGFNSDAEIEPVGTMFVNIKAVTDFFPWQHDLPTKQQ